jgi:DNA-directed RNA polymerase subunit RPC12/RpoP
MGVAIFLVLAVIAAGIVIYPLLPGRTSAKPAPSVTDGDIERAVRRFRQTNGHAGLHCPTCGQAYEAGDLFCVSCGGTLPQAQAAADGPACPACGATIRKGDRFCAKCGHTIAIEEVA